MVFLQPSSVGLYTTLKIYLLTVSVWKLKSGGNHKICASRLRIIQYSNKLLMKIPNIGSFHDRAFFA